jgi:hypothetical protein
MYVAGTALIALSVLAIVLRSVRPAATKRRKQVAFVVAISTLLVGAIVLAGAVVGDIERSRSQRTLFFRYFVDVNPSGSNSIRLDLPAPVDPRLVGIMEASNGTSTLRYDTSSSVASVVVDAVGHVSFDIRFEQVGFQPDVTLSRVETMVSRQDSFDRNVSIELSGSGPESVFVLLEIEFSQFCWSLVFKVEASVHGGAAGYPATQYAVVC